MLEVVELVVLPTPMLHLVVAVVVKSLREREALPQTRRTPLLWVQAVQCHLLVRTLEEMEVDRPSRLLVEPRLQQDLVAVVARPME